MILATDKTRTIAFKDLENGNEITRVKASAIPQEEADQYNQQQEDGYIEITAIVEVK